jgi:predicted alpha/beta superfamily hydrolase
MPASTTKHPLQSESTTLANDPVQGRLDRYLEVTSRFVETRHVDVWLPPNYARSNRQYAVLYLHDGQNLFEPELSFSGIDWGVDETLLRLRTEGAIRDVIAVGIWNTPQRLLRYMPQRPFEEASDEDYTDIFVQNHGRPPASDRYLKFIVSELKPFIDATYRTRPNRTDTFMMGASMGGLVSLYALCEYPEVFGGVGCLSTSWTMAGAPFISYLEQRLPPPDGRRVYLDYGEESSIPGYLARQDSVDRILESAGYRQGSSALTRHYPEAAHSEEAWRKRIATPLEFLLQ